MLLIGFALLLFFMPGPARAEIDPLKAYREAPVISVLTFGPGDAAFLKFGHNALRVQDKKRKTDLVYNFGTFQFDSPTLILDFLTGKFKYWLSVSRFQHTLRSYTSSNRSVIEQTINLAPWDATKLNEALIENAKPENRYYLYDYYRDNCSTRVRDALDSVLNEALEKRFQGPGQMTLREHTLRTVAEDFWLYLGLDIAMGPYIDQPETRYSEMFLPEKLMNGLSGVSFSGPHGAFRLVKETKTWYEATGRDPILRKPPNRTLQFLQAGVLIGAFLAFMGWEAYKRRQRWAQIALPAALALLGLVLGVLGSLFLGLWTLTNHEVAARNENILQCAPWALGLTVCAWGIYRARPFWIRLAYRLAFAGMIASALGLLFKFLPILNQHNERIIALALPVWCGIVVSLRLTELRAMRLLRIESRNQTATEEASVEPDEEDSDRDEPDEEDDEEPEETKDKSSPSIPPSPAPA